MSKPVLYYALFSPASRACVLTAKLINLELDLKPINFAKKEHYSDWYLKLNHRHTVPVLVDGDVPLCDSHAILSYIVSKYAPNDDLYPKDLLQRAKVDELSYFEAGVLFQCIKDIANKTVYGTDTEFSAKSIELCHTAYGFLEQFLQKSEYVAGKKMTIADISINTTLITLNKAVAVDNARYPKINAWIEKMKTISGYYEVNEQGAEMLYNRFLGALAANRESAIQSNKNASAQVE